MDRRLFLVAASAFAASLHPLSALAAESGFTVDGRSLLAAERVLVEEHLSNVLTALKVAALSEEARSGDWQKAKPLIDALAVGIPTEAAVWYAKPDGSYATAADGKTDQTLSDRDYFPGLISGKDVLGSLVISKSTGHRSVIVATPVTVDGKVVAALGVSVRARFLSDLVVTRTGLPDNLIFYALDPTGRTVLHRDPDKMFHYPSDMGDPSLNEAVKKILAEKSGAITYSFGGKPREALFEGSEVTGWKFVLVREEN
jgi:methyl-accepting chemotaxis protein